MKSRSELRQRIDLLINLFAIDLVKGKRQSDQIRLLTIAGMGPTEISKLIGTTPNTVNVCLTSLRNKDGLSLKERGEENG
jgi:tRNA A22 N-methylase